ncbi:MAG: anthranilate phosphoribosyltransferase [Promethearchaeota archaeon]
MDIRAALKVVVGGNDLSFGASASVMKEMMSGKASPAQIAAFLTALHLKGETVEEISACAKVMREFANQIRPEVSGPLLDTCGTGGDGKNTFNISTVTAIVAAAAGCPVAKHGNRAMSSTCGSADVLEALGVKVDLDPDRVRESIEEVGIGFMFAPKFHPAMRHASPVRREIGIPTVFNILGPLTNPAGAQTHLLGVRDEKLAEVMAGVLQTLGVERAYVVHGSHGEDEISVSGSTVVFRVDPTSIERTTVHPGDFGMPVSKVAEIACQSKGESVAAALRVLRGESSEAETNVVLLNSAHAIAICKGISPEDGLGEARAVIEEKTGLAKLEEFATKTTSLG